MGGPIAAGEPTAAASAVISARSCCGGARTTQAVGTVHSEWNGGTDYIRSCSLLARAQRARNRLVSTTKKCVRRRDGWWCRLRGILASTRSACVAWTGGVGWHPCEYKTCAAGREGWSRLASHQVLNLCRRSSHCSLGSQTSLACLSRVHNSTPDEAGHVASLRSFILRD